VSYFFSAISSRPIPCAASSANSRLRVPPASSASPTNFASVARILASGGANSSPVWPFAGPRSISFSTRSSKPRSPASFSDSTRLTNTLPSSASPSAATKAFTVASSATSGSATTMFERRMIGRSARPTPPS
jgi:hypothetical protein